MIENFQGSLIGAESVHRAMPPRPQVSERIALKLDRVKRDSMTHTNGRGKSVPAVDIPGGNIRGRQVLEFVA